MVTAELILKADSRETSFEMDEGRPLFVGRTMECDLHLPAPAVSRRHAVFMAKGGKCGVKDLDSANGTYLNGARITKPMRLRDGDVVQIANFVIEFKMPQVQSFERADKTVILSQAAAGMAAMAAPAPVLSPLPAVPDAPPPPGEPAPEDQPAIETPHTLDAIADPLPGGVDAPAAAENSDVVESDHFDGVDHPAALSGEPPRRASSDTSVRVKQSPGEVPPEVSATPDTKSTLRLNLVPEPEPTPEAEATPPPAPATKPAQPPMPPMPPPRVRKHTEHIASPDEIGDGDGDAAFAADSGQSEEIVDKELLMAKAAAEAGLMGEFVPDVPDPAPGEAQGGGGKPSRGTSVSGPLPTFSVEFPEPPEPDPYAIPIGDDFRQAIEARLNLYAFLADLREERDAILAGNASLPDAVKSEIDRQNREMDKMPPAEKAEDMITKRTARREDLKAKIREAKEKGTPMPPRPSKEMRAAEDIAINQWTLIAKSQREALPAVFEAGYRVSGREPLAKVLEEAKIDAKTMLGGASYILALGVLLEETKYNRAFVRAKLSTMQPPDEKQDKKADGGGGGKKRFGLFSKSAEDEEDGDGAGDEGGEAGESYEDLAATEKQLGMRSAWITQESAVTELAIYEDFGFSPRGKAREDIESGFFALDGKLPVNVDGGLKCFGHPVGASGLRMTYEIYKQLQGKADNPARQVRNVRRALSHTFGGAPQISAVLIAGNEKD